MDGRFIGSWHGCLTETSGIRNWVRNWVNDSNGEDKEGLEMYKHKI